MLTQEFLLASIGYDIAKCSLSLYHYQDGSCNGLQHYAALGRDYVSLFLLHF
jgi:hypothetical protein